MFEKDPLMFEKDPLMYEKDLLIHRKDPLIIFLYKTYVITLLSVIVTKQERRWYITWAEDRNCGLPCCLPHRWQLRLAGQQLRTGHPWSLLGVSIATCCRRQSAGPNSSWDSVRFGKPASVAADDSRRARHSPRRGKGEAALGPGKRSARGR